MTAKNKPKAHYDRRRKAVAGQPDPTYLRECPQHKLAYATKKIALYKAAKAAKNGLSALFAYKCPFCRFWHLTSQDPDARLRA